MTRLSDRLAAAADEMTGTEFAALRRGVDGTARRIGRRRAAFTTLGVLAVTGALTAAGLQVLPPNGTPGPAVNPTSTATTDPGPSVTPTAAPANAVPGTLVFLTVAPSRSGTVPLELTVIADGVRRTSGFGTTDFHESVRVVSPDLSKIATVHTAQDHPYGNSGDLVIIGPGGSRRTVASGIGIGGPEQTPVWTPDSTTVLATNREPRWRAFDVAGGGSPAVPPALRSGYAGYPVWSANGRYLAYGDAEGGLRVVSSDGTDVHRSFARTDWPSAACLPVVGCPVSLSAVSDDGRYVAVGSRRTSPGPRNPPRVVVDLQARRIVDLPDVAGELSAVFFRPDGGMLLYTVDQTGQSSRFYLLGRDLQIARTFPGPSRSIGELVAYLP